MNYFSSEFTEETINGSDCNKVTCQYRYYVLTIPKDNKRGHPAHACNTV